MCIYKEGSANRNAETLEHTQTTRTTQTTPNQPSLEPLCHLLVLASYNVFAILFFFLINVLIIQPHQKENKFRKDVIR